MRSSLLPEEFREVHLDQGTVRYREVGKGPTLMFVHGILSNSTLWREVVPTLAQNFRCVVPDWPLGGHRISMNPGADLSPGGVAQIVADFMDTLDLRDVTLVGNDTGGAICQLVVAKHRERLSRLVLTNCDAYEVFFPPLLKPFSYGAKFLGRRFVDAVAGTLRARFVQRVLMWLVSGRKMDTGILDAYMEPLIHDRGVRRDLTRFLSRVSNRYTLEAARSFGTFDRPVLIAWGENDVVFSSKLAHRLRRDFPNATLQFVPNSRAFVPEDQPDRLAAVIRTFVRDSGSNGESR